MSEFNVWSYFAKLGVQVRGPKDSFFQDGDEVCSVNDPVLLTVEDVEEFLHKDYSEFSCQVPGCSARFKQLQQCEQHYNSRHKHSCATCHKSLPSYHLLELHIQESHDSFFAVLSEKKASYQCFLPTCPVKFWGGTERRDHGISVHSFPPDFRFDQATAASSKSGPVKKARSGGGKPSTTAVIKLTENGASITSSQDETAAPMVLSSGGGGGGGNRRERRAAAAAPRNGGTRAEEGRSRQATPPRGDSMEVDGEEVVLRRTAATTRRPVSLARMGERRSVYADFSPPALPPPAFPEVPPAAASPARHVRQSFQSMSPSSSISGAPASPRGSSALGSPASSRFGGSMRLLANIADTSDKRSSVQGSPRNNHSINNGSGSSPRSPSLQSPRKSKIPVRSNSCRAPKQFSFGAGIPKTFQRPKSKHWYQSTQSIHTATDITSTDLEDLKNSLPS